MRAPGAAPVPPRRHGLSTDARFFGVDLAWGQRARTGLAVLDGAGRLVESTSVRTDDDIVAFVRRHASGTSVAAIDAPLVVPNETGRRPCEAQIGAAYARFSAGAYPANRGLPAFNPEPRGARLARELGWELDPGVRPAAGLTTCIEVYPHPAMVWLFGLDRVIPYKQKRGRDLASLTAAYARLLDSLEAACGELLALATSQRWAQLRAATVRPARKSELKAVEDEIDAIVCAYVGWLWAAEPTPLQVYGDYAGGYIVAPPPIVSTGGKGIPMLYPKE